MRSNEIVYGTLHSHQSQWSKKKYCRSSSSRGSPGSSVRSRVSQETMVQDMKRQAQDGDEEKHVDRRSHQPYALGDTLRCPSHMVIERSTASAVRAVDSLNEQDFAFVKRSDGTFTYASLASRSKGNDMTFSLGGSTNKTVPMSKWRYCVRLPSANSNHIPSPLAGIHATAPNTGISSSADSNIPTTIRIPLTRRKDEVGAQTINTAQKVKLVGENATSQELQTMKEMVAEISDNPDLLYEHFPHLLIFTYDGRVDGR